jgi:hypothetical protein
MSWRIIEESGEMKRGSVNGISVAAKRLWRGGVSWHQSGVSNGKYLLAKMAASSMAIGKREKMAA